MCLAGMALAVVLRERDQKALDLSASEAKARAIFDLSFGFIGLLTPDGTVLDVNQTALDFAGTTLEEVKGKPFWETPWWSHSTETQNQIRNAIQTAASGKFVREECHHPDKNGIFRTIDFTLKPVLDEAGRITLLIPEGRDITEHKQAESEIRTSQARLQAIFENAGVAICLNDSQGRYVASNLKWTQFLGYEPEETLRLSPLDVTYPDDQDTTRRNIEALFRGEKSFCQQEKRYVRKDGQVVWGLATVACLRDAQGAVQNLIAVVADITAQKRMEKALGESEAELAQSRAHLTALVNSTADMIWAVDVKTERFALVFYNLPG